MLCIHILTNLIIFFSFWGLGNWFLVIDTRSLQKFSRKGRNGKIITQAKQRFEWSTAGQGQSSTRIEPSQTTFTGKGFVLFYFNLFLHLYFQSWNQWQVSMTFKSQIMVLLHILLIILYICKIYFSCVKFDLACTIANWPNTFDYIVYFSVRNWIKNTPRWRIVPSVTVYDKDWDYKL